MPSISSPAADTAARLERLEYLANLLDSRFTLPGTGFRFGWDSLLGLVPGLGDLVTVGPAAWTLVEAWRLGARKRVLARMGVNTAADLVVGSIPLLGDLFDAAFKSNRRNVALLRHELTRPGPDTRREVRHVRA